ncbi:hypothetical protein GYA27_02920 [candidate division WWE3 bacterium]|uniref:Cadherin domain-containing protein n=1 Tax=candidate division WWE3 bacterium TaxID=2053526 RepID=A0A7X9HGQ2_UNCKA|nr:hypothetical protein [candidate division WWE3 bacterium]
MLKNKKGILIFLSFGVAVIFSASYVFAQSLLIRLEEPQNPNHNIPLHINFVVLDLENRPVTVKCFKQGPSDGGYTQFGTDQITIPGGNTGYCEASSSILNTTGTYKFYATAQAGVENSTSEVVTVENDAVGPGKPHDFDVDYKSCTDEISFKTDDDGGETTNVKVYRSKDKSFTINGSSLVKTITVGSDTEVSKDIDRPDCSDKYYYAIMAFDNAGNHSDAVGQKITKTETVTVKVTETKTSVFEKLLGAIETGGGNIQPPVSETAEGGEVAGTTEETVGTEQGVVEGASTTASASILDGISPSGWILITAVLAAGFIIWVINRKNRNKQI